MKQQSDCSIQYYNDNAVNDMSSSRKVSNVSHNFT
jgi:hypothetical protein